MLPPFAEVSDEEQRVFSWLVDSFSVDALHAKADGLMLLTLARKILLLRQCEKKIEQWGPVVLNASGSPMKSPYCTVADAVSIEIRRIMGALGMTPEARARLAPLGSAPGGDSWERFD